MNTENKYQVDADSLDRSLRLLCKSGCLEGREDIVLLLVRKGYQIERINRNSIDIISPTNEKLSLSGKLYSANNNKKINKLENILWILFGLGIAATLISRCMWMIIFDAFTSPAQSEFWLSLPETVRTDLNMWGYLVPPLFFSVAFTSLLMMGLIELARCVTAFFDWCRSLHLLKGGK
ncbi:TPA: hypothetical protein MYR45_003918 [Escherichia coli]|uniref:hypothetical protein n=1 Tax=Escherichia coli TaxID=562 RepID=UPI00388D6975|nr:hypothetical protein [Escherichia coli]HCB2839608.1 hypothetical protein [Escherichia coli]